MIHGLQPAFLKLWGTPPLGVQCNSERGHMTPGNKGSYAIFIGNDLISSEQEVQNIFSSHEGGFAENN